MRLQGTENPILCQDKGVKCLTIPPYLGPNVSMKTFLLATICAITSLVGSAHAGVFNIPQFVDYQSWAVGIEPEMTLSSFGDRGSGIGLNAKFTYGITPLSNLQVGVGTGSGPRGFRLGGTYTFDFIPDIEGQLGAGLALQAYFYKLKGSVSQTETTIYPYIHKMIHSASGFNYDPYVALPYGLAFVGGTYRSVLQAVFGTYFKTSEHFGFNGEIGINLKDTDTYLAFGINYRD